MGGTIKVILREEDGTIHNMYRWTNSFPQFINSTKFISKDKEHLRDYMKIYLDMKQDWEENHETGKFKYNMTPCYLPESTSLAPCGYGILVIDYLNNRVISANGYSSPGSLDSLLLSFLVSKKEREILIDTNLVPEVIMNDYQKLFDDGKIFECECFENEQLVTKSISKEDVINKLKQLQKKRAYAKFNIDMSPWVVTSYMDGEEDFAKVKEEMMELFEFTENDHKEWNEYVKDRFQDDYDEEDECEDDIK